MELLHNILKFKIYVFNSNDVYRESQASNGFGGLVLREKLSYGNLNRMKFCQIALPFLNN